MPQSRRFIPDDNQHLMVRPLANLGSQKSAVSHLKFSSDGTILASRGWETCVWYEDEGGNWSLHHTPSGALLQINSNQTFLMLIAQNRLLDRIELQDNTGACLQAISFSQKNQQYYCGYSPDQKWFLTYDFDGWLYFWDAKTLIFETRCLLVPTSTSKHYMARFHFAPNGKQLFFQYDSLVYRCQFESDPPRVLPEGFIFHYQQSRFEAEDFKISPQGNIVAVANAKEPAVELYESTSLQQLASLPAGDRPFLLEFSPDGRYLACVDDESRVYIWNVSTGQLEQTFVSHPGPYTEQLSSVASIAWSPRGDIIAIGGSLEEIKDYSIKLWKVDYHV